MGRARGEPRPRGEEEPGLPPPLLLPRGLGESGGVMRGGRGGRSGRFLRTGFGGGFFIKQNKWKSIHY